MQLINISKSYDKNLFNDVSFNLSDGDKFGLIGKNGVGKSTLLKIISGDILPDSGYIKYNGESVKLLKQEIDKKYYNNTILEYIKIDNKIDVLENELNRSLEDKNMNDYLNYLDDYLKIDGYNIDVKVKKILNGLGLNKPLNSYIKDLSGGEKIKVLLASLFVVEKDIYLLDEPTNNLDLSSIKYLEDYLNKCKNKMIIISHDEEFLNCTINKIIELKDNKIYLYNMRYNDYLRERKEKFKKEKEDYQRKKEENKLLKEKIQKLNSWTSKRMKKRDNDKIANNYQKERMKNTSSKVKHLENRMNVLPDFREIENSKINLSSDDLRETDMIILDNLIVGYDGFKTKPITCYIPFSSKVYIKANNGEGKTTLIRTILNEISPLSGKVILPKNIRIGYICQDRQDVSNKLVKNYLLDNLDYRKEDLINILKKYDIDISLLDRLYISLSPGERTKIDLIKLSINKVNTIILDEPTNHLDIDAIHLLERSLNTFNGTILFTSHNESFINSIDPNIIIELKKDL